MYSIEYIDKSNNDKYRLDVHIPLDQLGLVVNFLKYKWDEKEQAYTRFFAYDHQGFPYEYLPGSVIPQFFSSVSGDVWDNLVKTIQNGEVKDMLTYRGKTNEKE